MSISRLISRLSHYYRRHGFRQTVLRSALAMKRAASSNGMVLLYCDLDNFRLPRELPCSISLEQKKGCDELGQEDLEAITSFWNPKLAHRNIKERFGMGATLWLIRAAGTLAGYGWTVRGCTIEPHYLPLDQCDVHFFDFHVFPKYRGRGLNPCLINQILPILAAEGRGRAFIEAAEWNLEQLSSLRKTPFRRFGCARKWKFLGHTIVCWDGSGAAQRQTDDQPAIIRSDPSKNVRF